MNIKIKKTHPDAIVPVYGTGGAACFDLHALGVKSSGGEWVIQGIPEVVRTGLAFEIPEGHVMLLFSRSGHGFKNSTRMANCVGVIDSDYRGEVYVKLIRDSSPDPYMYVRSGDRIAQGLVLPVERVSFEVVEHLSETVRGTGGFGSTGA